VKEANEPPRRQGRQEKKERKIEKSRASELQLFGVFSRLFLFLFLASWRLGGLFG
jgi:hypothetical protein